MRSIIEYFLGLLKLGGRGKLRHRNFWWETFHNSGWRSYKQNFSVNYAGFILAGNTRVKVWMKFCSYPISFPSASFLPFWACLFWTWSLPMPMIFIQALPPPAAPAPYILNVGLTHVRLVNHWHVCVTVALQHCFTSWHSGITREVSSLALQVIGYSRLAFPCCNGST